MLPCTSISGVFFSIGIATGGQHGVEHRAMPPMGACAGKREPQLSVIDGPAESLKRAKVCQGPGSDGSGVHQPLPLLTLANHRVDGMTGVLHAEQVRVEGRNSGFVCKADENIAHTP